MKSPAKPDLALPDGIVPNIQEKFRGSGFQYGQGVGGVPGPSPSEPDVHIPRAPLTVP